MSTLQPLTSARVVSTNPGDELAVKINEHHALAVRFANQAIAHATEAGILLMQAKALMPHGQFLAWIKQHVRVSPRQCQRYMLVAQGKPLAIRAPKPAVSVPKRDADATPVSHLPFALPGSDGFVAVPDSFMFAKHGERLYCIEQSTTPGFFFVSAMWAIETDDAAVECLTRPIRGDCVHWPLQGLGMADPTSVEWTVGSMKAASEALQSMEVPHGHAH